MISAQLQPQHTTFPSRSCHIGRSILKNLMGLLTNKGITFYIEIINDG
jgi:hypothetical protein